MQEVILEKPIDKIHIEDLTDNSYVGIFWVGGSKSFVMWNGANEKFEARCIQNIIEAVKPWARNSIKEYVKEAFTLPGAKVFKFDNPEELFRWILE